MMLSAERRRAHTLTRREMLLQSALGLGALRCAAPADPEPPSKPNIVIFLPDSWRGDRLGCCGYPANVTPAIDCVAGFSYVFQRCYSAATWTKPSVASIFTGVLPSVHQAAFAGDWGQAESAQVQLLRPCFPTLAQRLREAGYQTAWFLANPMVQETFGFARGFDTYDFILDSSPFLQIDRVIEWLRIEAREPFFLVVHLIDPHYPFVPTERFMRQVAGQSVTGLLAGMPGEDRDLLESYHLHEGDVFNIPDYGRTCFQGLSTAGIEGLMSMYDAEIAGVDRQFGRLCRVLDNLGYLGRSMLVVTSDHGEAFGEHGLFHHRHPPYEHQLRVPLIVHMPAQESGISVDAPVSLLDLYPTLLAMAGVQPPAYVQGRRIFDTNGLLTNCGPRPILVNRDRRSPNKWDYALISDHLKVMRTLEEGVRVFDLSEDPGEARNLLNTNRGQSREVQDAVECLFDHHAACLTLAEGFGPPQWYCPADDTTGAMEALGYL